MTRDLEDKKIGGSRNWLDDRLTRSTGNGKWTLFWKDHLLEGVVAVLGFNDYELEVDENISILEMRKLG